MPAKPSYLNFDKKGYAWKRGVDYRKHSERYQIGKGEQGVLICEPYKSELVAHWRFRTPEMAEVSSKNIYRMFLSYLKRGEFVGADMARKFLQMGFTRARRYANYKGGRKYAVKDKRLLKKGTGDLLKAKSAAIFYQKWKQAEKHPRYQKEKEQWRQLRG